MQHSDLTWQNRTLGLKDKTKQKNPAPPTVFPSSGNRTINHPVTQIRSISSSFPWLNSFPYSPYWFHLRIPLLTSFTLTLVPSPSFWTRRSFPNRFPPLHTCSRIIRSLLSRPLNQSDLWKLQFGLCYSMHRIFQWLPVALRKKIHVLYHGLHGPAELDLLEFISVLPTPHSLYFSPHWSSLLSSCAWNDLP